MLNIVQTIPIVSVYDEEEDAVDYYHRDSGNPIGVVATFAPTWKDDEILTYEHITDIIPNIIDLYKLIRNQPNGKVCRLVDYTEEEDSEPLPFILGAVVDE